MQFWLSAIYTTMVVLMAFAGVVISPFWFAGHLLMIVQKSVLLHIVIRSVLLNGWSLLLTALLTIIVVYLFIIIGYVFFKEDFVGTGDDEGVCSSLLECFAFGLLSGLRAGGGLGDLLPRPRATSFRIVFDFAFFLIIVVIILNIVFGIIIDTFAQLRDQKHSIEEVSPFTRAPRHFNSTASHKIAHPASHHASSPSIPLRCIPNHPSFSHHDTRLPGTGHSFTVVCRH